MQFVPVISILVRRPPRRGGDPFSHPSGSGVERRPGCQTNDGRRTPPRPRPPPGIREPENIQCPDLFIQIAIGGSSGHRLDVQPFPDSGLGGITKKISMPLASAMSLQRDRPLPYRGLAWCPGYLGWFTAGLPNLTRRAFRRRPGAVHTGGRRA